MRSIKNYLTLILMGFFAFACNPVVITPKGPPAPTRTPTPGPTLTPVPTCSGTAMVIYSDDFSNSSTLSNYEILDKFYPVSATAQITGGEMLVTPGSGLSGLLILVKDSALSRTISDYILDFDAKMDQLNGYGNFGAAFRGNISPQNYSFVWNGNPENTPPHWQAVNFFGIGGSYYAYLGGSSYGGGPASPLYTPGNWIHFEVVCKSTNVVCSVDNGSGSVTVFNFNDSSYPTGGVGFDTGFIQPTNLVHFKNLVVKDCP